MIGGEAYQPTLGVALTKATKVEALVPGPLVGAEIADQFAPGSRRVEWHYFCSPTCGDLSYLASSEIARVDHEGDTRVLRQELR